MNDAPIPRPLFSKIHEHMPILCVDLTIILDDRVLLLKRDVEPDRGRFWMPGGRLRKLESFHEAAIRIARNEVGMAVEVDQFVGYTNCVFEQDPFGHGKKTHTASLVFACRPISVEVKIDRNHTSYIWWDGKIAHQDIPLMVRELSRKALKMEGA